MVENLHDIELVGKVPENVSAELILREFDPREEIITASGDENNLPPMVIE